MTIAVTGATGHLGRLVVENLLEAGVSPDQLVATGRSVERLSALAERGVRALVAPYEDLAALTTAFAGVDTLVLVSGSEPGVRVAQHTNVIEAARAAGVGRIVYTSIAHADTSDLLLVPEHRATEEVLRSSGVAWTLLRNNWYSENYVATVAHARQTGVVLTSTGTGRVASASRADFAAAAAAVALGTGHEGRTYELSGDVAWSFDELAGILTDVLGRPVSHRSVDTAEHVRLLVEAGLDEGTAGFVAGLDAGIARGDLADATRDLRTLIGRPTTPIADSIRAFAAQD
ncbi:SDR family oxidoreductase [Cellulomonas edaphi]|uniref:SDR family oxidoreductase n=1 Tax=Cellulomonas edaphi TaxID=3053468 RepID=A0ABT7S3V7_9CELL|nr:SDR family oxidoreductase [Cellulomons edaphi]MDM7830305.1 SDR family oxidoreductase [Cellulomons edaphi]